MQKLYTGLLGLILMATACQTHAATDEQSVKLAALRASEGQCILLEQLQKYITHAKIRDKQEILYQLNLLKACASNDGKRIDTCSLEDIKSMLFAGEFIAENLKTNIPAHIAQICTNAPAMAPDAQKSLSTAELLERYQKLQEDLEQLIKKVTELNMTRIERFFNSTDTLYTGNKEWLEPIVAATTLGLCLWKSSEIKKFISDHKLECSIVAAFAYYLRAQKRSTIAGLKDKLPAAVYYPLAFAKWTVGSHEKALRVTFPYGTDINIGEVRKWISKQEKACGVPVVFEEDKLTAPFGFGAIGRLIGIKTDIAAPFSFAFGADGDVKGNALLFTYPEKK